MFHSLRFRLPALFLAGIALTGVLAAAIAFGLFQDYTQDQARRELRREAAGLTQLYAAQAVKAAEQNKPPPFFAARKLEAASGNRLYYVGLPFFSGQGSGLRRLPQSAVDWIAIQQGTVLEFDFVPPGEKRKFLAVANPLRLEKDSDPFGALVVATPQTELRDRLDDSPRAPRTSPARRRVHHHRLGVVPLGPDHPAGASARKGGRRSRRGQLRRRVAGRARARRDLRSGRFVQADGLSARRN